MTAQERPVGPAGKRVSGKIFVPFLVGFLCLASGTALTLWWTGRVPDGPIRALAGHESGDAILLRDGYEGRDYTHLMRVAPDGTVIWVHALFGGDDGARLEVVGDVIVAEVYEARGRRQLHAFEAEEGTFLWRGGPPSEPTAVSFDGPRPEPGQERVYALWLLEEAVEVVALPRSNEPAPTLEPGAERPDPASGRESGDIDELWRMTLPRGEGPRRAWMDGEQLAVAPGDGQVHRIGRDGVVASVAPDDAETPASPCSGPLEAHIGELHLRGGRVLRGDRPVELGLTVGDVYATAAGATHLFVATAEGVVRVGPDEAVLRQPSEGCPRLAVAGDRAWLASGTTLTPLSF